MLEKIKLNNSYVCYNKHHSPYTAEYYWYCTKLLVEALTHSGLNMNVIMGDHSFDFQNDNKTFKFDIQPEHTLVKLGGRSVDDIIYGDIDTLDGDSKYLVRIPNYAYYNNLDCVMEYSIPNIINIESSSEIDFSEYLKKSIYIAAALYKEVDFEEYKRTKTITMFSSNPCPRRDKFKRKCNMQGFFTAESLKKVYNNTRIMVNVHQTDHHHTFEELRCLPALMNGVIIVSEDVPLKDKIPYSDYIVWAKYEDLEDKVKEVEDNYEKYYRNIFTDDLKSIINTLQKNNLIQVQDIITKVGG